MVDEWEEIQIWIQDQHKKLEAEAGDRMLTISKTAKSYNSAIEISGVKCGNCNGNLMWDSSAKRFTKHICEERI